MDGTPTGGAIWGVVLTLVVLLALWAMGRITLIASQHDPNPPSISTDLTREEVRP
jgi:amino acid permease